MLDLNDFFYFVQVVDRGGFTAASRTLRLPKSTLSHRIRQLEAGLGVRLLNRTSRRFGMTDAGGEFYRHATEMLQQAEQAEASIRHRLSEPIGTVRFTSGTATMQFALREAVTDFLSAIPGRVEDGRGSLGLWPTPRFPSPLIKPDEPISGIRLSDWLHRKAHDGTTRGRR